MSARKLFTETPAAKGKMNKVQCKFCKWICADNATRLEKHLSQCLKCPSHLKKKYVRGFGSRLDENCGSTSSTLLPETEANSTSASSPTSFSTPSASTIPIYNASNMDPGLTVIHLGIRLGIGENRHFLAFEILKKPK